MQSNASTPAPTAAIETITPELAKAYLGLNRKNRSMKDAKVHRYARDIKAGNWMLTGEAIKFDTEGNLIDGQNRCMAVVRAGVPIQNLVMRGVSPDAMKVMDSGSPRSVGDALNLSGHTNGKDLAAAINTYTAYVNGVFVHAMSTTSTYQLPSHSEAVALAESTPGLVEATQYATQVRKSLPLPIGSIATAFYLFTQKDADLALEFFERIKELRTNGRGDPIAALIRRVLTERHEGQRIGAGRALFYMVRTWNAFVRGEELARLQVGSATSGWAKFPEVSDVR